MDELERALKRMAAAVAAAREAGEELSDADYDEFLRGETGGKYGWDDAKKVLGQPSPRNIGRGVAQGAMLNFADDAVGLFSPEKGEEMRLREKLFRAESPKAALGADVAGGMITSLLPAAGAARVAQGARAAIVSGAGAGMVGGGLSAAGAAEGDLAERAKAFVPGALIGGAAGAAIPGLIGGARYALNPAARANRRIRAAVEADGGEAALRARAGAYGAAGRGNEVTPGDLGDNLRWLVDEAANTDPGARTRAMRLAGDRQQGMAARLDADRAQLGPLADADGTRDGLMQSLRGWASSDAGYEGLRRRYPNMPAGASQQLTRVIDQPVVRRAWDDAQEVGLIGKFPDLGNPSFQHVQDVKEKLDDAVTKAYQEGRGNLATRLRSAREVVLEELGTIPEYAPVAAEYRARLGVIDALDQGVGAWHIDDMLNLGRQVQSMAPEQLQAYRTGMASEMRKELQKAGTNKDVAQKYVRRGPLLTEKLRVVFGDEQTFQTFAERADIEEEMARMRGTYGNSMSEFRKSMRESEPIETMAGLTSGVGLGMTLANAVTGGAIRTTQRRTGAALGEQLLQPGAAGVNRFLDGLRAMPPDISPLLSGYSPFLAGALLGSRSTRR